MRIKYKGGVSRAMVNAICPLSGIEKRPLVGGYLYTSVIVFSIGATAGVLYREVVRWWEGPLWEIPL